MTMGDDRKAGQDYLENKINLLRADVLLSWSGPLPDNNLCELTVTCGGQSKLFPYSIASLDLEDVQRRKTLDNLAERIVKWVEGW